MVIYSGNPPFLHYCMFGNSLSFLLLWLLSRVNGHDVFFSMAGHLGLVVLVRGTLGALILESWLAVSLSDDWVLILLTFLVPGLLLIIGMLMILPWRCADHPNIFGLMVAGRIYLLSVGLKWLALVFICLLQKLPLLRVENC